MALHAEGIIALAAAILLQAPVALQGSPPWWQWLLPTLAQTILCLVSIAAGVWIAVWAFRTTSKREHEQWLLDEKMTEWRSLLVEANEAIAKIDDILSKTLVADSSNVRAPEEQRAQIEEFRDALASGRRLLHQEILIRQKLLDFRIFELWEDVFGVLVGISENGVLRTTAADKQSFVSARDKFLDVLYSTATTELSLPSRNLLRVVK